HVVDEPTIDSFVEMRRLDPEPEKPEQGRETDDQPGRPIGLGQPRLPFSNLLPIEDAWTSRINGRDGVHFRFGISRITNTRTGIKRANAQRSTPNVQLSMAEKRESIFRIWSIE